MKNEISAGVITYRKEPDNTIKYLILQYGHGHWDLPKGKLEPSETALQAAERELMEETGLKASILPNFQQPIHYLYTNSSHQTINKTVTFFIGEVFTDQVQLSDEHNNYQWLEIDKILHKLTYESSRQLLEMADFFIKNLSRNKNNQETANF